MTSTTSHYAYRSTRHGDRVRRTYLGTLADPVVRSLLESERLTKATRDAERREVEHELVLVETMDRCLQLLHFSINRAIRNLRKRWRRSNRNKVRRLIMSVPKVTHEDYEALVADAADGDMDALAELRQLLKETPQLREVLGSLNHHVQYYLIELAAGGAIDVRVSLMETLAEKRQQLLTDGDSLIEQMLIDLILSTMLDAAICQMGSSQPHARESIARRWERRLTCAQARHQSAVQSLVEVRQMLETNFNQGNNK